MRQPRGSRQRGPLCSKFVLKLFVPLIDRLFLNLCRIHCRDWKFANLPKFEKTVREVSDVKRREGF